MRKVKLALVGLLVLTLGLGLAAASWAEPGGMGGMGPGGMGHGGMMNLTPDQAGKMFDLRQKFMDDTANLRKQMCIKRAELAALWKAENPDQGQIVAKEKEINALRDQLEPKAVAFKLEDRKIAPQACMGRGHGGMGAGCGMGGPGMGMGPGMAPPPSPPPAK
jgi:zinc resistance-associated protein